MSINNPQAAANKVILDSSPHFLRKTITFTGGEGEGQVGQATIATPTGIVLIKQIIPVCTSGLDSATHIATLSLGRVGAVNALLAVTVAADIGTGEYWLSATPGATLLALPAGVQNILIGAPITVDILLENITTGVLVFDILYVSINGSTLA